MVTSANTLNLLCRFGNEAPEPFELKTVAPSFETKNSLVLFDSKPVFEKIGSTSNTSIKTSKKIKPICNPKNGFSIFEKMNLKTAMITAGVSIAIFSALYLKKHINDRKIERIQNLRTNILKFVLMSFVNTFAALFVSVILVGLTGISAKIFALIFCLILIVGSMILRGVCDEIWANLDLIKDAFTM